jgi:hypothetical protein
MRERLTELKSEAARGLAGQQSLGLQTSTLLSLTTFSGA